MSLSTNILRHLVAGEFNIEPSSVRVSGYLGTLDQRKANYGYYVGEGFKLIKSFMPVPVFIVVLHSECKVTVHCLCPV